MHHQIGITPDRAREMQIIRLRQAVMAERLGRVARAFQTFEESDLEGLLLSFPLIEVNNRCNSSTMG